MNKPDKLKEREERKLEIKKRKHHKKKTENEENEEHLSFFSKSDASYV